MTDERPSDVLGALPHSRPHRRSDKRASPAPAKRSASSAPGTTENGGSSSGNGSSGAGKRTGATTAPRARTGRKASAARREPTATRRETGGAQRNASAPRAEPLPQPAQPGGVPPTPPRAEPSESSTGRDILTIAAQTAAELAEIGLSVSARVLRNAVSRLPRP